MIEEYIETILVICGLFGIAWVLLTFALAYIIKDGEGKTD